MHTMEPADVETIPRIGSDGRFPSLEAFRYPTFRRVFSAGFVSQLGDWMQIVARASLAYDLTHQASSVGWIYFATYMPQLLLSMWGGVLADRFDRRRLLVGCQVAQMAGALVLGVLAATGTASLVNIAALSFVIGIANALNIPAAQALQPAVVSRASLSSAITLSTAGNSIARVLGPVLSSIVINGLGLRWAFWLNAASFLAVIFAWVLTRVPRQPRLAGEVRSWEAMQQAMRYVRNDPRVWVPIVVSTFISSVGIVYQPLMLPFANRVLSHGSDHLGNARIGPLQAAIGLGAFVGILGLAGAGRRRPGFTLVVSAIAFSITLITLGRTSSYFVALAICFAMGAAQFANITVAINLVQHDVPEIMRGRVMSIQMMGLIGLVPIASLAGGTIADHVGIPATISGAGALCLVFSVWALRWQRHVDPSVDIESVETIAAVGVVEQEG
ncbi:MAG: hypothetical protein QOF59_1432 [Actinomycetota bacterium]|nr:hypothetical protein [Actinomycetota bacterium]MDQ1478368.1 hypothetical protein [Actinomycetota bacterium]